jgi:hypothetical protein
MMLALVFISGFFVALFFVNNVVEKINVVLVATIFVRARQNISEKERNI